MNQDILGRLEKLSPESIEILEQLLRYTPDTLQKLFKLAKKMTAPNLTYLEIRELQYLSKQKDTNALKQKHFARECS